MANIRKSTDGRKRARTMEYIDSQVDINDEEPTTETSKHLGQHIHAQFDMSMSLIDEINTTETSCTSTNQSISKLMKRNSERMHLSRQMSDISLNHLINETSKTTTELKGRDHVLRAMKTTNQKPILNIKNHKFIQEMIAKRQEKQEVNRPISDFALKYGLIDNNGKKFKSRTTSDLITDMSQQLENLKSTLTKRQTIDSNSSLLRIVKIESVCNQLLCYCQYVTDREDIVLFLDPNDEQSKNLSINDEIRITGESRLDMDLPELGSVTLGITDIRKESIYNNEEEIPMEIIHTYDFNCPCRKCNIDGQHEQVLLSKFDLASTFPNISKHGQESDSTENFIYDSFTAALMKKRRFNLRASIIIYENDQNNNRHIFVVRDGIGNPLQIILDQLHDFQIEIQTRIYIFHQIEFLERIESPKESNRWPYDDYAPPKKLFCFRSLHNQVSIL